MNIGTHLAFLKMLGYTAFFNDKLKSVHKWGAMIFAIDFTDFTSRLSGPGPLFLSSFSISSYISLGFNSVNVKSPDVLIPVS